MACHLFDAKPLHEPMLAYCQLNSWEHTSVKFESEFYHFHSRQCNWKCHLPKWWPFFPRGIWVEQPWSIWANKSHKSWIKWKWILLNTQKHNLDIQSISRWNNTWAYSMGYTATAVPLKWYNSKPIQHIEARTKWPPFSRWHFHVNFLKWKCMNFK